MNRLELTPEGNGEDRYKRIVYDTAAIDRFLVNAFLQSYAKAPERIVLDLDTTDDEIHGGQEGRFFHGYYGSYCYLPLYIFSGEHLLCARLRQSNVGPAEGTLDELERIVSQIREQWPNVKIVIRADSAFSRDDIMSWCEEHGVDYVLGLARNARLERMIASEMEQACAESKRTGRPFRSYKNFEYQTRESWSCERRVVGKAEYLVDKPNARFVVTSLAIEEVAAQPLYENDYCGRGDMENRIKEQKTFLFSDRTSAATMRANQLRLWFSSVAYLLMSALRRLGLKDTDLAKAQCDTIRLKLFKIGARITVTTRKIWISLSSSYPLASLFAQSVQQPRSRLALIPFRPPAITLLPGCDGRQVCSEWFGTAAFIRFPTAGVPIPPPNCTRTCACLPAAGFNISHPLRKSRFPQPTARIISPW